jgi:hypothetical protein
LFSIDPTNHGPLWDALRLTKGGLGTRCAVLIIVRLWPGVSWADHGPGFEAILKTRFEVAEYREAVVPRVDRSTPEIQIVGAEILSDRREGCAVGCRRQAA